MWRRLWALCLSMPDGSLMRRPPEAGKMLVRRLHKVSRRRGYGSGPGFSSSLVSSPEGRTLSSPSKGRRRDRFRSRACAMMGKGFCLRR